MLLVLFIIAIALIALGVFLEHKFDDGFPAFMTGGILFILVLVFGLVAVYPIAEEGVIDQKIEMYQEENQAIEDEIDALVKNYMDYEQGTVFIASGDSYISLVSLYPELKADTLVQQQIEIHTQNNQAIKELKEQKLDVTVAKWWLYFGK